MSFPETGLYLYGVARRDLAKAPLHIEGVVQGEKVDLLVMDCLALAVNHISINDFAPGKLKERLQAGEMQWVKEKAMAHATVQQELMKLGPILPVRFGTIFQDTDGLLSVISLHEKELISLLDQLEGKAEWGVRICCAEEILKESLMENETEARILKESLKCIPEGTAYLYRKKLEMLLENKSRTNLLQWTQQIHDILSRISDKGEKIEHHHERQDSTGEVEKAIFNGAYLVRDELTERFRDELEILGNAFELRGLHFYVSGPWPPYHFTQLKLEAMER